MVLTTRLGDWASTKNAKAGYSVVFKL